MRARVFVIRVSSIRTLAAAGVEALCLTVDSPLDGPRYRQQRLKLELPPGRAVELKPGGYHVMLMDLKAPFKQGETVPITLKVHGKSGQVEDVAVRAEVRDAATGAAKH